MSIEQWWSRLRPESRAWLVANNGDVVPPDVVEEITSLGASITSDEWWVGENGPSGLYLSDAAVDWLEEVANDELPDQP